MSKIRGLVYANSSTPRAKALSPAVNDPYTAIQAVDHLAVLFSALAARPLGDHLLPTPDGTVAVIVPGRSFASQLNLGVGLIRRYGSSEPTVIHAFCACSPPH